MLNENLHQYFRQWTSLSEEGIAQLAGYFETRTLEKGEAVLKAGEVCTAWYFVEKGYLRTYYNKADEEINIRFALEGALTTDMKSSKTATPSEFTIEAGEKSVICLIERRKFSELNLLLPEIQLFTGRLFARIAIDMSAHSNLFKIYSPAERYEYIEKNNPQLLQRIPLSHLASYLGVTRRTLTRIRGKK